MENFAGADLHKSGSFPRCSLLAKQENPQSEFKLDVHFCHCFRVLSPQKAHHIPSL